MTLPAPASRHALALLRFPDRRTAWVVLLAASAPVPGDLDARLSSLHRAVPMVGARLVDEVWYPGAPAPPRAAARDPLGDHRLRAPFDLATEPPLRVAVSGLDRIVLAGHHAAFDGLALVAVLSHLLGGPLPTPVGSPPPGQPAGPWPALRRLARPADRVPASRRPPPTDSLAVRTVEVSGPDVTARLAAACGAAAGAAAERAGRTLRRLGITLAVGGPAGVGNVASYCRIDVPRGGDVTAVAKRALAERREPPEQVKASRMLRLLAPISDRFSDSILVSNLGRHALDGARQLEFFPVARGRSAVAFGAAGVAGGLTTLSIRARDIDQEGAERVLDDAVAAFDSQRP